MTPFTDIYDLAQVIIIDYKIDKLASVNFDAFCTYMRGLLTLGIPEFKGCMQSLDYTYEEEPDEESEDIKKVYYFNNDLTLSEKSILAKIVCYNWWVSKIQETTAFQPKLAYREFKQLGTDQNLKQKSEYRDKLREDISQSINEYQLENLSSMPFFGGA